MKSVLISGAASGIGLATARQLASDGYRVYGGYHTARPPAVADAITWLALDVTSFSDACSAVDTVRAECRRLDVLINNAGVHVSGAVETIDETEFRRLIDVNLLGAWNLCRAALPGMRRASAGHVVMISSLSGLVGLPGDGAYAASKFALEGLAQSLALEVARWNIRISILEPGPYRTGLARRRALASGRAASRGAYQALLRAIAVGDADSPPPEQAASEIAAHIANPGDALRVPVGDLARRVFARLDADHGQRAKAIALDASGLGWWIEGRSGPPKSAG